MKEETFLILLEEMDNKKRERFMETFNELKTNFTHVFSKLSTKGEVEIIIEDEKKFMGERGFNKS